MTEKAICKLCGEPLPAGEEMFKYHGYSGDCPKPPLPRQKTELEKLTEENAALKQRSDLLEEAVKIMTHLRKSETSEGAWEAMEMIDEFLPRAASPQAGGEKC
jgi:hypothetical protein